MFPIVLAADATVWGRLAGDLVGGSVPLDVRFERYKTCVIPSSFSPLPASGLICELLALLATMTITLLPQFSVMKDSYPSGTIAQMNSSFYLLLLATGVLLQQYKRNKVVKHIYFF